VAFDVHLYFVPGEINRLLSEALGSQTFYRVGTTLRGDDFYYSPLSPLPRGGDHTDPVELGLRVADAYRREGEAWFQTDGTLAVFLQRHAPGLPGVAAAILDKDRALAQDRLTRFLGDPLHRRIYWKDAQSIAARYALELPEET
jgi:hypothetical protein